MATFLLCGKYSSQALEQMSAQRTQQAVEAVQQCGGEVEAMYATLGQNDLLFIVSLPGIEEAMKASIALTKLTGIAFSTTPAIPVQDFDTLIG